MFTLLFVLAIGFLITAGLVWGRLLGTGSDWCDCGLELEAVFCGLDSGDDYQSPVQVTRKGLEKIFQPP